MPLSIDESLVSNGYILSAGSSHPEAAWRWLSFLSQQPVAELPGTLTDLQMLSSRITLLEPVLAQLDPPLAAQVRLRLNRPVRSYPAPQFAEALLPALQAVLNGTPANEALRAVTEQQSQGVITSNNPTVSPFIVASPMPTASSEITTIVFNAWGLNQDVVKQLAKAFTTQNPAIQVEVENRSSTESIITLESVADGSDCFAWGTPPPPNLMTRTLDLQPLIDADARFPRDDYPSALIAQFQQNGGQYGLPRNVRLQSVAYQPTLFDQTSLAYPTPEWTIEQFVGMAERSTRGEGEKRQYGVAFPSFFYQQVFLFTQRSGASLLRPTGGNIGPNYTDPKVQSALQPFVDLLRTNSPHQSIAESYQGRPVVDSPVRAAISSGRVSMWVVYDFPRPVGEPLPEYALAPPPQVGQTSSAYNYLVSGLYISSNTPYVQECWKWLQYLGNNSALLDDYAFPARRSLAESEAFLTSAPEGAAAVYSAYLPALQQQPLSTMEPRTLFEYPVEPYWLLLAIERTLQGGNLERELSNAQTTTEQYLACVQGGSSPSICKRQVDPTYAGL